MDESLRTPLYHQIYLILRDEILNGRYGKDALLPGEQELGKIFGVSRITAKRALDELAVAGLVVRERGRGTRVRFVPPSPPVYSSVEGLLENLMAITALSKGTWGLFFSLHNTLHPRLLKRFFLGFTTW
ncbi:GntR family transcriptional regulator [Muriicola sp.]|uniref:GntR family transcriptional regulator n=1 Tax=Muriicola sp. TaxID=2020856 RepID=UPI0035616645